MLFLHIDMAEVVENPSLSKTRTYIFYIVNIMGADVLALQGVRASLTMILTMLNRINSIPALYGLTVAVRYASTVEPST